MGDGPSPLVSIIIVVLGILAIAALFAVLKTFVSPDLQGNLVHEDGTIRAVFCAVDDCEQTILGALRNATDIACLFYDLDLPEVIKMLQSKEASVFVFEENAEGQPFPTVTSEGLMHHKFCVIDDYLTVTGSMNPTANGAYKNDNHLLFIESHTIAHRYLSEFEQVSTRKSDDYKKKRVAPRYVNLTDSLVQLQFCPQEPCETRIIDVISDAESSIQFMTFTFTSDPIGDALLAASDRGVVVQGVFEARQNPEYSEFIRLEEWGLDVTTDGNPATMHHKVFIIDDNIVVTGSYNPTWSAANKNDENLLIIEDEVLAGEFSEEFRRIWAATE